MRKYLVTINETQSIQRIYEISEEEIIKKITDILGELHIYAHDTSRIYRAIGTLFERGLLDDCEVKNPNANVDYDYDIEDVTPLEEE